MHVCLLSTEILGWGPAGGFGFATRSLGNEIVKRGHRVTVVLPQPRGTSDRRIMLDEIEVCAYPRLAFKQGAALLGEVDSDIYHSQEPSVGTWLAKWARPSKRHFVTCRDPRLLRDWLLELRYPSYSASQVLKAAAYYENFFTREGVRRADRVFVPAQFLRERVKRKYSLKVLPKFLPTPIRFPAEVSKARRPMVCFIGRLDRRKRPEAFLELPRQFPDVQFVCVGAAQDPRYASMIQTRYGDIPNLELTGFIDQFADNRLSDTLGSSWILVNTSVREGLPNSFIEACGYRCAILSAVDPDTFASRFGEHVPDRDFAKGLRKLLQHDAWRARGDAGYAYVKSFNESSVAAGLHLDAYQDALNCR
ncbi:MAG: glycosyltransferase [Alphaproteobacteria bacterium]|nr:glycosyltransferase [Alphaproteobacteria bacterium]